VPEGILLRFPDEADFLIDLARGIAIGWPAPGTAPDHYDSLFQHGVVPMAGNHHGGLFLHGSAVAINGCAVAFIAPSRSGKTTLAGAFAKAGYPILTEDVIELVPDGANYWLQPKQSNLRLFVDSAAHLFGRTFPVDEEDNKHSFAGGEDLPFSAVACPLVQIYLLGSDHNAALAIAALDGQAALVQTLPHAFVLDVADKPRLREHFCRIAQLSERIACRRLDYPRRYDELLRVVDAILTDIEVNRNTK